MPKTAKRSSTRSSKRSRPNPSQRIGDVSPRKIRHQGAKPRRLSRPLLDKKLRDLLRRIQAHIHVTQSFEATIAPNGEHIYAEAQVRETFGVLLESQLRSLSDIEDLTRSLCDRETVSHD